MVLDRFWAIFKTKCIYEEKCETVLKRKRSVENLNYKETLILVMQCCCGDNVKYRLLSKRLFQWNQEHDGCKKCQDYNKFLLEIIKWKKKHRRNIWKFACRYFSDRVRKLIYSFVCMCSFKEHTYRPKEWTSFVSLSEK